MKVNTLISRCNYIVCEVLFCTLLSEKSSLYINRCML